MLGMHRSGTSAVARIVNLLGVDLGKSLVPAAPANNEAGFWEHAGVVGIDEEVLAALGRSWDDPTPLPLQWWEREPIRALRREAVAILSAEFGQSALFGIKDPRMCRLLPFWRRVFGEAGYGPSWIVTVRDPFEVAASLRVRDGIPAWQANLLWLEHALEADLGTRDDPRVFVAYEHVLADWHGTFARIADRLGIAWPTAPDLAAAEVERFLRPDLRHQRTPDKFGPGHVEYFPWTQEAYRVLLAASGEVTPHPSRPLSQLHGELDAAWRIFLPWLHASGDEVSLNRLLKQLRERMAQLEQGAALRADHARNLEHILTQRIARIQDLEKAQAQSASQIGRLQDALEVRARYVSQMEAAQGQSAAHNRELQEALDQRAQHVAELEAAQGHHIEQIRQLNEALEERARHVSELESSAAILTQQLGGMHEAIEAMQRSTSWRLTAPLRAVRTWLTHSRSNRNSAPVLSVLVPATDTDVASLERTVGSLLAQGGRYEVIVCVLENEAPIYEAAKRVAERDTRLRFVHVTDSRGGLAQVLNAGLHAARGVFVGAVAPGDEFEQGSIPYLLKVLRESRDDVVYSDEDVRNSDNRLIQYLAKPDWSPELALSYPYTGRPCLFRRKSLVGWGGWRVDTAAAEDYDLVLHAAAVGARVGHLRRVLYHRRASQNAGQTPFAAGEAVDARRAALNRYIEARGIEATVVADQGPGRLRIRPAIVGSPLASIIIPTRDRLDLLSRCVQSIERHTAARYEIVIVDNDSKDPETLAYFKSCGHTVVRFPGKFNFSAINNAGASATKGNVLVFLNNDTEILNAEWLDALLEWALQPDIGCVGAKLLFPDGRLQHVGVTLHHGSAHHPCYAQYPGQGTGWLDVDLVRNYSAVTAACLAVRRTVFDEVGGFDPSFPVAYNDVDLCLRVLKHGYRNVYTPYAVIRHFESASRTPGVEPVEIRHLRKAHGPAIANDPFCPEDQRTKRSSTQPPGEHLLRRRLAHWHRRASRLRALFAAALWSRTSLYALPPAQQPDDDAGHVRWMEQVVIAGRMDHALFMHPDASRTFSIARYQGGKFRAAIGLLPEAWDKNQDGVQFAVSVTRNGRVLNRQEWIVDPSGNPSHRRWRNVVVKIPAVDSGEIELTLETRAGPGASLTYAWAAWGSPELVERKALLEVVRRQVTRARCLGLRGLLAHYRQLWFGRAPAHELYARWTERERTRLENSERYIRYAKALAYRPLISILTPVYNTDPRWLRRCVESVRAQFYGNWELCLSDDGSTNPATVACLDEVATLDPRVRIIRSERNSGISGATNAALQTAHGEFVGLLDHDDELAPDALYEIARHLNAHPDTDLVYTDEDKIDVEGRRSEPYFKPDWSPEYLRSTMYLGHFAVYRREVVESVGGFRSEYDGAQDYDLALRVSERTARVGHVPGVLYHWRTVPGSAAGDVSAKPWGFRAARRALADHVSRLPRKATVEDKPGNGYWRVRYEITGEPLVSVVIPTDGRVVQTASGPRDLVLALMQSISERTAYRRYELVIVDNGRLSTQAQSLIERIGARRVTYQYSGPFNFATKVNFAVAHARGEHIVLLNDDTEVLSAEWLTAMLEYSQQPEIGAVGARLLFPDGRLQHIGVVLGIGGGACHVFSGQPADHPGYFGSAWVVRNYSAVTGACMMTRRSVFDEVGGFDERFSTDFNDVDYCLRVGARGYRIVATPFAELLHFEGATFGSRERTVNPTEIAALSERWAHVIARDPFYNPNLTVSALDYGLRF